MGDVGEAFKAKREWDKERKEKNLAIANALGEGWTQHTPYHWSRDLNGHRLDYWPTTTRFQYKGKIMCGGVEGFIRNRTAKPVSQ